MSNDDKELKLAAAHLLLLSNPDNRKESIYDAVVCVIFKNTCCNTLSILSIERPAAAEHTTVTAEELDAAYASVRQQAEGFITGHRCGGGSIEGESTVFIDRPPPPTKTTH